MMQGTRMITTTYSNLSMKRHSGFSLVEVLIALIIMSVGMLGIAGLYVQSMQAGRTSVFRHHAVTLAGDVADRVRANPRAGVAYASIGADNNCVAKDTDCNPAAMAAHDIFLWDQQATDTLPAGTVTVNYDGATMPPEYTIIVAWTEAGENLDYTIMIPVLGF